MPKKYQMHLASKSIETDAKKLILKAVVSKQILDRDNEVVDLDGIQFKNVDGQLAIPIMLDHERNNTIKATVGGVKSAEVVGDELIFEMEFSNKKSEAIDAFYLIADGHLVNPFSIGYTYKNFDGVVYSGVEIHEVSLTAFPANQASKVIEIVSKSENTQLKETVLNAYESIKEVSEDEASQEGSSSSDESGQIQEEASQKAGEEIEENTEQVDAADKKSIKVINGDNKMTDEEVQDKINAAIKETADKVAHETAIKTLESIEAKKQEEAAAKEAEAKKEVKVEVKETPKEILTIKALRAGASGDRVALHEINTVVAKQRKLSEKALHDYTNMGQAILCEELDRDVTRCVETNLGAIGGYVGRYNLTQSDTYSYLKIGGQLEYFPVDDCAPKADGGNLNTTKNNKRVQEWALLGAVCDNLADDLVIDIYNNLRDELTRAENGLVGKLVFNYDGGGDVDKATGILVTPGVPAISAPAATKKQVLRGAIMSLCAGARAGAIWSMSEATWYDCVLPLLDCSDSCSRELGNNGNFGNFIQTLWDRPIIIDNSLPADTIILGDFKNFYKFITKGVRTLDFTKDGKSDVLGLNAWDRDLTLYRSYLRATGAVKQEDAFVIITCV